MTDRTPRITDGVPPDIAIRYRDMQDGTHALVHAVKLINQDAPLLVDEITNALVVIPVVHHEIHEGAAFTASHINATLANNLYLRVLFRNPPGSGVDAHLVFEVQCGGNAIVALTTDPGVTAVGTGLLESNRRLNSANMPECRVYHTPTVAGGDVRLSSVLPGGAGGNAAGGTWGERFEWIIPPGTDFVVAAQNISGVVRPAGIVLEWYEEEL